MNNKLPGHDDLKPREVVGVDGSGKLLVDYGEAGIRRFRLFVTANSKLTVQPFEEAKDPHHGIDQLGSERESAPLSKRLASVDQG